MSDKKAVVSIKSLYHRYGKDWAVKDVNFEVRENGIVGLLGSNGAGKSTTMNSLCGIISPTKGTLKINDFNIRTHPIEAKKNIGFLPQNAPLYLELTVDEYLYHCARLRKIPKSTLTNAVAYAKEYCGVTEYSKRLIANLSGGYRQRVGIAQAIVHRPKLVVLDEPTNGLDPVQITEVRNLIRKISEDSAVLLSTHMMSEVQAVCKEIIMIEKGEMVFEGTINQFNELIKPSSLMVGMHKIPNKTSLDQVRLIEGINSVSTAGNQHIRLNINNGAKVEEAIVKLSVNNDWGLFEIYKEKVSLESVFAKLSNRELKD